MSKIKGYKAFDKGLICRGKQYAENTRFTEKGTPRLCNNGIHFCEKPLDVLKYYSPFSEFAEVEALGEVKRDDNKSVTNEIQIKDKISIFQLYDAHFKSIFENLESSDNISQTSGYRAHSQTSGDEAHSQTSGNYAHSQTSGDYAHSQTSGNDAHSQTSGDESIACALGVQSRAKAVKGWIVITDWRKNDVGKWEINKIYSGKVGHKIKGIKIQPDTFYWFENGVLFGEN